jgi:tRNA wybutosine-synthesizing protein 4
MGILILEHTARFCLIEQVLPDGPENPFADTMLRHFDKLSTPLRCVHKYPLIKDQQQRFRDAGWPLAIAHDLWKLWRIPEFLTANQRAALNTIEPFDEWEEFALFASHYFLLFAGKSVPLGKDGVYGALLQEDPSTDKIVDNPGAAITTQVTFYGPTRHQGCRRFAAAAPLEGLAVSYHGGLGTKTRLNSSELILHDVHINTKIPSSLPGLRPRMCHTLTCLEEGRFLLVGGRASPDDILADCWIYDSPIDKWHRVGDITAPRYRHCAVELPNSQALVFGGKTSNNCLLNDCVVWTQDCGWENVCIEGDIPPPCFGATMVAVASGGIFVGGMTVEGTVLEGYWEWDFKMGTKGASVKFQNASGKFSGVPLTKNPFCRFGASLVRSPFGSGLLLVGGIHGTRMLERDEEILFIDTTNYSIATLSLDFGARRPLLVGCSVISTPDAVMIIGGGAVCFSFGTFWNDGLWTLSARGRDQRAWRFQEKAVDFNPSDQTPAPSYPTISHVRRLSIKSAQDFEGVLDNAQPAILEGLDIGSCSRDWSFAYLKERIGVRRQVRLTKDKYFNCNSKLMALRLLFIKLKGSIWTSRPKTSLMFLKALGTSLMQLKKGKNYIFALSHQKSRPSSRLSSPETSRKYQRTFVYR